MKVGEWMTRQPVSIEPGTPVADVYRLMRETGFEGLPVTRDGFLVGVVTPWDVLKTVMERSPEAGATVSSLLVGDPVSVGEDELLEAAAFLLHRHDFDFLPVLDRNDRVIGVITKNDLFRAFVAMMGLESPGTRIALLVPDRVGQLAAITAIVQRHGIGIASIATLPPRQARANVVLRVQTTEAKALVDDLMTAGFRVTEVSQVWA